jgi:CYTH domain-containing protein
MKKNPVSKGDFSEHIEDSINLEKKEYEALYACSNKRVSKNRYKVEINGYVAEVDVFTGDMTGLVLIDFEFKNREEHDKFKTPDCCLVDVTQELTIRGGQLAGQKYEDIEDWLTAKGYREVVDI